SLEPELLRAFAISRRFGADDGAGRRRHRAVGHRRQAFGRTGVAPHGSRGAKTHARLLQPLEPGPGTAHTGAPGRTRGPHAASRLELYQVGAAERRLRNRTLAEAGR